MIVERTLEEILVTEGFVTRAQLEEAYGARTRASQPLSEVLQGLGYLSESQRVECQALQAGIPYLDLANHEVDPQAFKVLPKALAYRFRAMIVDHTEAAVTLAMANPMDLEAIDTIAREIQRDVDPVWVGDAQLNELLQSIYGTTSDMSMLLQQVSAELDETELELGPSDQPDEGGNIAELRESAEGGPVVQLANALFAQAIAYRASDIHLEPLAKHVRVRYRIDGVLKDSLQFPREIHRAVVSRIKILSGMDIAERRAPQDGRCSLVTSEGEFDFRVASYPTVQGEKICIRVLDKRRGLQPVDKLNIDPELLPRLLTSIESPQGLVIVSGPTGSGKTTTLYSLLGYLNQPHRHIITVEDPVEYQVDGIQQAMVNVAAGVTFASGLRAMLRQDPDVILVGETRDPETAKTCIEASLTGHMVLTSLHANCSLTAVTRLVELGVEPFLVGASLTCSIAQRLARRVCPHCSEPYSPDPIMLQRLGLPLDSNYHQGIGCDKCANTGYAGRLAIHEVLVATPRLRHMITEGSPVGDLAAEAKRGGFKRIHEDAAAKTLAGLTTVEEVLRVVSLEAVE